MEGDGWHQGIWAVSMAMAVVWTEVTISRL